MRPGSSSGLGLPLMRDSVRHRGSRAEIVGAPIVVQLEHEHQEVLEDPDRMLDSPVAAPFSLAPLDSLRHLPREHPSKNWCLVWYFDVASGCRASASSGIRDPHLVQSRPQRRIHVFAHEHGKIIRIIMKSV